MVHPGHDSKAGRRCGRSHRGFAPVGGAGWTERRSLEQSGTAAAAERRRGGVGGGFREGGGDQEGRGAGEGEEAQARKLEKNPGDLLRDLAGFLAKPGG